MPAAILGPIAGSVVGGLMSDSGGGGQTATKEPWAEAAPWLKQNLKTGQDLQGYYQQNPFSQQQQTGYQNQFADIDNYRQNVSPALQDIVNKYLTRGGGQGMSLLQAGQPGGADASGYRPTARAYGLLDFAAANPHTNGAIAPPPQPAQPAPKTWQELAREEEQRQRSTGEWFA